MGGRSSMIHITRVPSSMAKASGATSMVRHTQVIGRTTCLMDMGSGAHLLRLLRAIWANGNVESAMALGFTNLQMATCMRVTGRMAHSMTEANTLTQMAISS